MAIQLIRVLQTDLPLNNIFKAQWLIYVFYKMKQWKKKTHKVEGFCEILVTVFV